MGWVDLQRGIDVNRHFGCVFPMRDMSVLLLAQASSNANLTVDSSAYKWGLTALNGIAVNAGNPLFGLSNYDLTTHGALALTGGIAPFAAKFGANLWCISGWLCPVAADNGDARFMFTGGIDLSLTAAGALNVNCPNINSGSYSGGTANGAVAFDNTWRYVDFRRAVVVAGVTHRLETRINGVLVGNSATFAANATVNGWGFANVIGGFNGFSPQVRLSNWRINVGTLPSTAVPTGPFPRP